MPLDTNLLYGEMVGSWIIHLAIPFGTAMLVGVMPYMELTQKTLVFIAICMALSGVAQAVFLMILQASSCKGVKDYGSIFVASLLCATLTAVMVAIPAFIEPMRLVVSQLFFRHKTLLTPQLAKVNDVLIKAGEEVAAASRSDPNPQVGGAAITPMEYEAQTFQEIASGASYWAAFAGAYGVGIGSLFAAKCPASS